MEYILNLGDVSCSTGVGSAFSHKY